jgi:hypothetical protein
MLTKVLQEKVPSLKLEPVDPKSKDHIIEKNKTPLSRYPSMFGKVGFGKSFADK